MKKRIDDKIQWMLRASQGLDEVARYRPITLEDEFDEIPDRRQPEDGIPAPTNGQSNSDIFTEAGEEGNEKEDEMPNPETGPKEPQEPTNAEAPNMGGDDLGGGKEEGTPELPGIPPEDENTPMGDENPMDMGNEPEMGNEENVEQEVDVIQNDIMRHNIEAVKAIADKLKELDVVIDSFNEKVDMLNAKVKEVEEPTNAEKLMSKKDVSYPYYFNLPDYWRGNWYEQKYAEESGENRGIRQLPDGTYIADFDDLDTMSDGDVEDSITNMDKMI